tara:strand:+ start:222 stop:698 length:477 start_codon:yes stop_codon:yes gene_type:complete
MQLTIQSISYDNPEDKRILKACLIRWFENPKDLNLTDPNMKFPFNFDAWIKRSYAKPGTTTFIAKDGDWIIGYISILIVRKIMKGHLFHLFVDPSHRKKGIGTSLINHAETYSGNEGVSGLSLNVAPNNDGAIRLYTSLGYEPEGKASSGSFFYKKWI